MASGFKWEGQIAWTVATSTAKAIEVKEVAKQCPGDKFYVECKVNSVLAPWIKFTPESARVSLYAPTVKVATDVLCSIAKKSTNG